eukprot:scaffold92809_cov33-Phaeocystis_antarctica.AAC.2
MPRRTRPQLAARAGHSHSQSQTLPRSRCELVTAEKAGVRRAMGSGGVWGARRSGSRRIVQCMQSALLALGVPHLRWHWSRCCRPPRCHRCRRGRPRCAVCRSSRSRSAPHTRRRATRPRSHPPWGSAWCMVHGAWCMVHGAWCMVHGAWCSA